MFSRTNVILIAIACVAAIAAGMFIFPMYGVWQQEKQGEAALMRAGQERQIITQRAKAELAAAEDTAAAIGIVGKAAKEYPEYRIQEFMSAFGDALSSDESPIQFILVPTEGQIPVMFNMDTEN